MALSQDNISEFLKSNMGLDVTGIDASTPLFSSGLLDSFSMVELIMFIEEEGGFRIKPTEVNLDNLDSIDRILTFAGSHAAS